MTSTGQTTRTGTAGEVLMDYLAAQADRIAAEEARVRRGEPDSVHQLRVASRRLRSALQAYRPLLDRERTEPVAAGLRELGRALAPARDAEVLREGIGERSPPSDRENGFALGVLHARGESRKARIDEELPALWRRVWTRRATAWMR